MSPYLSKYVFKKQYLSATFRKRLHIINVTKNTIRKVFCENQRLKRGKCTILLFINWVKYGSVIPDDCEVSTHLVCDKVELNDGSVSASSLATVRALHDKACLHSEHYWSPAGSENQWIQVILFGYPYIIFYTIYRKHSVSF